MELVRHAAAARCRRKSSSGWQRCAAFVAGLLFATASAAATPPPAYFFVGGATLGDAPLGTDWLTADERAFLAQLPEVRVALARTGGAPYEVLHANGEIGGIQAETLATLARAAGIKLKPVVFDTWPEVMNALREGRADMVLALALTPERVRWMSFTLGSVPVPYGLFARRDHEAPRNSAVYALEDEYASVDAVPRRYPGARVERHPDTLQALRSVAAGQADYYVGALLEVADTLRANPLPEIGLREVLHIGSGHYHFGVRKDWAPLVAVLNRGITGLRGTPSRALSEAMTALGPGAAWPQATMLSDDDKRALERHPIWRVGAVRGLTLLNDIDNQGAHSGIAADYTEQTAARLGIGTETVGFDNVAAMLDALRAGRIDIVPFLTRTTEREKEFRFSQPYVDMPYMLLGRADGPLYWDLGSLRGARLALAQQHPLRPVLAARFPDILIVDAKDSSDAVAKVLAREADAGVEVKVFANLHINGDTGGRLRAFSEVRELPAQFHFAARPDAAPLISLVNRVIDDLPRPERERMLRRWVAVDLNPPFQWRRWLPLMAVSSAALLLLAGATLWWVRRLSHESRARQHAVDQLEDIGRASPAVTFRYLLDEQGRLRDNYFSPGAARFFGVEPKRDMTLQDLLADRIAPADLQRLREAEAHSLKTLEPARLEGSYHHPGGHQMRFRVEIVHSRRTGSGMQAWTGVVTDVTPEFTLQRQLREEAEQRYVMLASASHELRAPTHILSLALQSLPESLTQGESARAVGIARDAARTLVQLLDDVLDAARLTAGRVELRPQNFDLRGLLDQLADAHADAAAAKGLAFRLEVGDDVPRLLRADPLRLKQVLTNLLSNALKYTQSGEVALSVGRGSLVAGAPALRFCVRDSGVGIAPSQHGRLYEPFGAGDAAPGVRSTGLGLSVCRRLVTLMGGVIDIHSERGSGTQATVVVPLLQPGVPQAATMQRRDGALLVCDDDAISRMLLCELLRSQGHPVLEAGSAAQALAAWRSGNVRLLITDLNMPQESGAELIAKVRAEERAEDRGHGRERTPIVVCSGDPAPSDKEAGQDWDAFLSKPVDLRTLIDTLAELGVLGVLGVSSAR